MTRTILIYGTISGVVIIAAMVLGAAFARGGDGGQFSQTLGYLIMIVALSVLFVAIKRYRDRECSGVIRFLPAFLLGLGISVVAGVAYVISWEIYLSLTDYAFIQEYTDSQLESRRAAGVSGAELELLSEQLTTLEERYKSPFFRLPMTFLEIFPVGLVVSLISAALLRNRRFLPAPAARPDRASGESIGESV